MLQELAPTIGGDDEAIFPLFGWLTSPREKIYTFFLMCPLTKIRGCHRTVNKNDLLGFGFFFSVRYFCGGMD